MNNYIANMNNYLVSELIKFRVKEKLYYRQLNYLYTPYRPFFNIYEAYNQHCNIYHGYINSIKCNNISSYISYATYEDAYTTLCATCYNNLAKLTKTRHNVFIASIHTFS